MTLQTLQELIEAGKVQGLSSIEVYLMISKMDRYQYTDGEVISKLISKVYNRD